MTGSWPARSLRTTQSLNSTRNSPRSAVSRRHSAPTAFSVRLITSPRNGTSSRPVTAGCGQETGCSRSRIPSRTGSVNGFRSSTLTRVTTAVKGSTGPVTGAPSAISSSSITGPGGRYPGPTGTRRSRTERSGALRTTVPGCPHLISRSIHSTRSPGSRNAGSPPAASPVLQQPLGSGRCSTRTGAFTSRSGFRTRRHGQTSTGSGWTVERTRSSISRPMPELPGNRGPVVPTRFSVSGTTSRPGAG